MTEFSDRERKDFDENPSEDHPYMVLRALRAWLYGNRKA